MSEGLDILLVGMGAVFAFLTLLVGLLLVSGRVFRGLDRREAARVEASSDTAAIAVAVAAAARYRRAHAPPDTGG